jgi:hypothetical protein
VINNDDKDNIAVYTTPHNANVDKTNEDTNILPRRRRRRLPWVIANEEQNWYYFNDDVFSTGTRYYIRLPLVPRCAATTTTATTTTKKAKTNNT